MPKIACESVERGSDHTVFVVPGLGQPPKQPELMTAALVASGDYNVVSCGPRGQGGSGGDLGDLSGTVSDLEVMAAERIRSGEKVSFVGHSLGGTAALSASARLAARGLPVESCFAVSALNDSRDVERGLTNEQIKVLGEHGVALDALGDQSRAMPEAAAAACPRKNMPRAYLVHSTNDRITPVRHFSENAQDFCVPPERQLVRERMILPHEAPPYDPAVIAWVLKRIGGS